MYQKYQTDVLVLRNYERGEADRVFALYTKEFGSLWARCSSVRREGSKMRYALQNYSYSNVSLVRGSGGWRLAGARSIANIAPENENGARTFARIATLVERLAGEEKSEYLFTSLVDAHSALMQESEKHAAIELLCVARVLYALGYVSAEALGTALFTHTAYGLSELTEAEAERAKLLSSVNRALSEAHI